MKTSGRGNDNALALRRNRLQNDDKTNITSSTNNIDTHSHSQNVGNSRPYSRRLDSIGRAEAGGTQSNKQLEDEAKPNKIDKPIVIHVIDENKKKQKDFNWSMEILLKHMKYFEKHLKSTEPTDDIDISVHWDILIFEWLLNFIEWDEREEQGTDNIKFYDIVSKEGESMKLVPANKRKKPAFEIGNAISILISSDYLKMSKLVDQWLDYFVQNINEILKLPIDMSWIVAPLQERVMFCANQFLDRDQNERRRPRQNQR